MTTPTLYPLNDFATIWTLKDVDTATGKSIPLTTGTVTGILATTSAPTATAADPALSVAGSHLENGKWLVFFDASVLTAALLDAQFGTTPPYLIVTASNGVRAYMALSYAASRPATVA